MSESYEKMVSRLQLDKEESIKSQPSKEIDIHAKDPLDKYFKIHFVPGMSESKNEAVNILKYEQHYKLFGESATYSLGVEAGKNILVPNFKRKNNPDLVPNLPPSATTSYVFVIVKKEDGVQLRISTGGHYFAADKEDGYVLAAGDLRFNENQEIKEITDKSGAYFVDFEKCPEQYPSYENSLRSLFAQVQLPFDKFQPMFQGGQTHEERASAKRKNSNSESDTGGDRKIFKRL